MKFNRTLPVLGKTIDQPSDELLRNTPGLYNASLKTAMCYGGELTRAALSAMNLRMDRTHVIVDVKVHNLMPGMIPAIPGWHTDGTPRPTMADWAAGEPCKLHGQGIPDLTAQEHKRARAPRYHLLVTGVGCLTEFSWDQNLELKIPEPPTRDLYALINIQMETYRSALRIVEAPSCQVVEWDWWNLHSAKAAQCREWRYLIRVTETDYAVPSDDLNKVFKIHEQVSVPSTSFGW